MTVFDVLKVLWNACQVRYKMGAILRDVKLTKKIVRGGVLRSQFRHFVWLNYVVLGRDPFSSGFHWITETFIATIKPPYVSYHFFPNKECVDPTSRRGKTLPTAKKRGGILFYCLFLCAWWRLVFWWNMEFFKNMINFWSDTPCENLKF